jgi:hypothetical protein
MIWDKNMKPVDVSEKPVSSGDLDFNVRRRKAVDA